MGPTGHLAIGLKMLVLLAVVLVMALVAFRVLRRPRRHGQTPHCAHCDYNLTGLAGHRCPECGSTTAHADESRSAYEFTFMQCDDCGESGFFDSWQRDFDWTTEVELEEGAPLPPRVAPLPAPPKAPARRSPSPGSWDWR